MIKGALKGWKKSIRFKFDSQLLRNLYWENEVKEEMARINNK